MDTDGVIHEASLSEPQHQQPNEGKNERVQQDPLEKLLQASEASVTDQLCHAGGPEPPPPRKNPAAKINSQQEKILGSET